MGSVDTLKQVERIAFDGLEEADKRFLREAKPRPWDPKKAVEELTFLDDPTLTPPATLPMCAQAVARRLQFGVLQEELRHVSDADQLGRGRRRRHADGGSATSVTSSRQRPIR